MAELLLMRLIYVVVFPLALFCIHFSMHVCLHVDSKFMSVSFPFCSAVQPSRTADTTLETQIEHLFGNCVFQRKTSNWWRETSNIVTCNQLLLWILNPFHVLSWVQTRWMAMTGQKAMKRQCANSIPRHCASLIVFPSFWVHYHFQMNHAVRVFFQLTLPRIRRNRI